MKIGNRFAIFQLTIVIGFLISASVVLFMFSQLDKLKALQIKAKVSLTALDSMIGKTNIFPRRGSTFSLLWEDWHSTYRSFDYGFNQVNTQASEITFLSDKAKEILTSKRTTWNFLNQAYIPNLFSLIDIDEKQLISQAMGRESINVGQTELLADGTLYSWIIAQAIDRINEQFKQLTPVLEIDMKNNIEKLISELDSQNSTVYLIMLGTATVLTLVFQLGSSLFVIRSSRNLGMNISGFEKKMSAVADGNFDLNFEMTTKDELEDIARHFSTLTQDLWSRIDSLKNMMGNIEIIDDYHEMQKALLKLAIEYSHADSTAILTPMNEGMLTLTNNVGFFPPLAPLPDSIEMSEKAIGDWYKNLQFIPEEENLKKVMDKGKPVFVKNNNGNLIHNNNFTEPNYVSSAMFIPLITSGSISGVLCLTISNINRNFSELDFAFMQILADFMAITLDNTKKYIKLVENQKIRQEIEVATHIQKTILPTQAPNLNGIKISAYSDAAKGIGGDYYDFFQLDEDKIALIICDVSGKGVPASLMMIMIRTLFRSIAELGKSTDTIMAELNKLIIENADVEQFATVSILIIDTRSNIISYSNGAHYPLYLFRSESRKFRIFDSDGLPVGIDIDADYSQKSIKVEPEDYILLFTDGLVEARNNEGEELGVNPILRLLASNSDRKPDEVVQRIRNFIQNYADEQSQHDDQTLIAIKIAPN